MLVLDPKKRYTIEQIRRHRWMKVGMEGASTTGSETQQQQSQKQQVSSSPSTASLPGSSDYDEQILKLMHTLGIEPCKTIEVRADVRGEGKGPVFENTYLTFFRFQKNMTFYVF